MFGPGAEVLGRYVCLTRASSFLPFLIKFLEASLEFCLLLELVFPDLDSPSSCGWPIALLSVAGSGVSCGACPGTEDSPDAVRSGAPSWHSMMALGCSNLDRRSLLATRSLWGS